VSDSSQPSSIPQIEEDSDEWLNIDAQDFEAMLEQTVGSSKSTAQTDAMDVDTPQNEKSTADRLASERAAKLKELATKVENFVEGEGDLDGVRFEEYVLGYFPLTPGTQLKSLTVTRSQTKNSATRNRNQIKAATKEIPLT